jgi:PKD repeat protein
MINAYTVKLTATNKNGEDTETKEKYITVTMGPVAEFTVDERSGKAPFMVKFRDLSTGNPTSWMWEFGDGTVSYEQNPVHLYPYEGAYDVRLTVANAYGTDTIFKTGTSSQRGSAEPVPLTAAATATAVVTVPATQPTTGQVTQATTAAAITTAAPTATYAPVSPVIPVIALCVILAVFVAVKRK